LTALAIGYLHWAWPSYVVGVILAFGFTLLFVRNHRVAFMYLACVGVAVGVGHGLWATLGYAQPGHVASVFVMVSVFATVAFVIQVTLDASDDGVLPELQVTSQTVWVTVSSIVLGLTGVLFVVVASVTSGFVPAWLNWGAVHALPVTVSVAVFALLVSSISYTVGAQSFAVDDVWQYQEIAHPVQFGRLRLPDYVEGDSAIDRFLTSFTRTWVRVVNGITAAAEGTFNQQLVPAINGAWRAVIAGANAAYRWTIKTGRHVVRALERFVNLSKQCAEWSWILSRRFAAAFILPIVLSWLACAELWWLSEQIRGYVLHQMPWSTPAMCLARIVFVAVLLPTSTMTMVQVPMGSFMSKLSAAGGVIGGRAFLFFVFICWTLGLWGWLTGGPFGIGWVTLMSTGLIVAALVALRIRRRVAVVST
jgi:hypothetical protein